MEETWSAVDHYIADHLIAPDAALQYALKTSAANGLPEIHVSESQGKFLQLLVRMHGARRVLELGTLGGYSTIWLAGGLPPGGRLVTVEFVAKHAAVARENIARAGFADRVEIRVGPALEVLPQLEAEGVPLFDFIFIDANKEDYPAYFQWALALSHRGSVIIADNVVRDGAILNPGHTDPRVRAVRKLYELIADEPRVSATAVQTVGEKGYDGFIITLVVAD